MKKLKDIKRQKDGISRQKLFADFHKKLGSLVFFDPACGSGNFLTEAYLSLRKLENELIALEENLVSGQHLLDTPK